MGTFLEQVASPLAAGLNIAGDVLRSRYQKQQQEREFAHNREMSEYAYSKDLEQWHRANVYNAPTQQMARLREAGLNPAMIYGSGGAKTVAAQLPKYQAPRANYTSDAPVPDIQGVLAAYQNYQKNAAEIKLIDAQADTQRTVQDINRVRHMSGTADYNTKYFQPWMTTQSGYTHVDKTPAFKKQKAEIINQQKRNIQIQQQIDWWVANQVAGLVGKAFSIAPISKGQRGIGKLQQFRGFPK